LHCKTTPSLKPIEEPTKINSNKNQLKPIQSKTNKTIFKQSKKNFTIKNNQKNF